MVALQQAPHDLLLRRCERRYIVWQMNTCITRCGLSPLFGGRQHGVQRVAAELQAAAQLLARHSGAQRVAAVVAAQGCRELLDQSRPSTYTDQPACDKVRG